MLLSSTASLGHPWAWISSTASSSSLLLVLLATLATEVAATSASPYPPPLQNTTQPRDVITFTMDMGRHEPVRLLCYYPISGNYCLLPRVLFYATILAALVLRRYPWLFVGALVASLTYSASAAIHACLLWWSNRAWGELDMIALAAILSVSGTILVPLLSWSTTIRNAGRPATEERQQREKLERLRVRLTLWNSQRLHHINERRMAHPASTSISAKADRDEAKQHEVFQRRLSNLEALGAEKRPDSLDQASRIVLIAWGLLVIFGFAFVFSAVVDPTPDARYGRYQQYTFTDAKEVNCVPNIDGRANATIDWHAGQEPEWPWVLFSSEFLEANGCQDPCPMSSTFQGDVLFRSSGDRVAMSKSSLDILAQGHDKSSNFKWNLIMVWTYNVVWVLVFVLLQVVWTILLGRSAPKDARLRVYRFLLRLRLVRRAGQPAGRIQRYIAKVAALAAYVLSVCATIIALPLLVTNVTLAEIYMQALPQSESPIHIGAWMPYTNIALGLIAILIGEGTVGSQIRESILTTTRTLGHLLEAVTCRRRSGTARTASRNLLDHFKTTLRHVMHLVYTVPIDMVRWYIDSVMDSLHQERKHAVAYWKDPDGEFEEFVRQSNKDYDAEKQLEDERLIGASHVTQTEA